MKKLLSNFKIEIIIAILFVIFTFVLYNDYGYKLTNRVNIISASTDSKLKFGEISSVEYIFSSHSDFDRIAVNVFGYDSIQNIGVAILDIDNEENLFTGTIADLKTDKKNKQVWFDLGKKSSGSHYEVMFINTTGDPQINGGLYLTESCPYPLTMSGLSVNGENVFDKWMSMNLSVKSNIAKCIIAFTVLFLMIMCDIICRIIAYKEFSSEKMFLVLFGSLALLYFGYFQVFNINDGLYHFYAVYMHSNQVMNVNEEEPGYVMMRASDAEAFATDFRTSDMKWYNPMLRGFKDRVDHFELKADSALVPTNYTTPSTNIVEYLPPVVGLIVSRLLHLGTYPTLFVCFLVCSAFYAFVGYWTIKIMPFFKDVMVMILCLPIALEEGISIGYDCFTLSLAFFTFAICLNIVYEGKSKQKIALAIISTVGLLFCKGACYVIIPFVLLMMLKDSKIRKLIIRTVCICFAIAIVFVMLTQYTGITDFIVTGEGYGRYSYMEAVKDPLNFIRLTIATLFARREYYFSNMNIVDYYLGSMFGANLGWNEMVTPFWVVIAVVIVILILAQNDAKFREAEWDSFHKFIIGLFIFGEFMVINLALFGDTKSTVEAIAGIQGRYFLPFVPAAFMLAGKSKLKISVPNTKKNCYYAYLVFHVITVYFMMRMYMQR